MIKSNGPSSDDGTSVRVAVRVRPLLSKELLEKSRDCVYVDKSINQVNVGKTTGYRFDFAFDKDTRQEMIYSTCVFQLVESIFQGYNATVLAYGQTGSGKTFTMGTANNTNPESDDVGIIPRVIQQIFDKIDDSKDEVEYMVRVSYYEIYNENVKDLLNPNTPPKTLVVREDENKGIVINGIKEEVVTSYEEMMRCLETGSMYRTVGTTLMNETSSRSHSIFTIILEQRIQQSKANAQEGVSNEEYKLAKFHLVDLAGSERNKRTGAVGIRFKEAVQINSGLLALGNVISALGDEKKRALVTHVPYRDSKLTRLLQDSLGGNSRTVMIACVSPADSNFEETINTLKYAHRARNIRNKPVVNTDPHSAQLAKLKDQINALQLELLKQKMGGDSSISLTELMMSEGARKQLLELQAKTVTSIHSDEFMIVQQQNGSLKLENTKLNAELQRANETISHLSESMFFLQSERDKYYQKLSQLRAELRSSAEGLRTLQEKLVLTSDQKLMLRDIILKIDEFSKSELQRPSLTPSSIDIRPSSAPMTKLNDSSLASLVSSVRRPSTAIPVPRSDDAIVNVQEFLTIQKQLKEAQDDLTRDEKIFSEKMREIKKLNKINAALKQDNALLKSSLDSEAKRISDLEKKLQQLSASTSNNEVKTEDDVEDIAHNQEVMSSKEADKSDDEIQMLELEKQRILEEKQRIEEEKSAIEQQVIHQKKNFMRNHRKMEQNLKDLTIMIRLKEELIRDLVKSDNESQVIKQQYEQKIQQMENEVVASQQELDKVMKNLEAADMDKNNKEQEKKRIAQEFDLQMKKKNQEIVKLRKKQVDSERLVKEKYQSERRVRELEAEIFKMKSQQEYLKKKIKDESDRFEEKVAVSSKQIVCLKKESETSQKRIRELESENSRQKMVLKRRAEEIQRAQAKLLVYKANREKSHLSNEIDKQKAWLDSEIEKYLKKKEAMETLEKELQRREAIIKERENMLATKIKLERKKVRSSQTLNQGIISLTSHIELLKSHIAEKELELRNKNSKSDTKGIAALTEEISEMKQKLEKYSAEKAQLEDKARDQEFAEEEALRELDERTEVLEAEIEFKNEAIALAEKEIREEGESINMAFNDIRDIPEAKNLLRKYFEKVIELKEEEQVKTSKLQKMEVVLQERDKIIENMQNNIRLTEMVYERKLTKQQKENELKIQYLLKQIATLQEKNTELTDSNNRKEKHSDTSKSVDEENLTEDSIDKMKVESMMRIKDDQIQMLDKDNFYYKQTNKDLKRKLREIRAKSEQSQQELLKAKKDFLQMQEQNDKLSVELKNLKTYLFKHTGVVQQVRKSIKSIKEIQESDVEQRRSSSGMSPALQNSDILSP